MPADLTDKLRLRLMVEDSDESQSGGLSKLLVSSGIKNVFTRLNALGEYYKINPRVEIKASIGDATGHRILCPDGVMRFDNFNVLVAAQCVSRPKSSPKDNTVHDLLCGKVISVFSSIGGKKTFSDTVNFPVIFIAEPLKYNGVGETSVDEADNLEYTTMSWSGIIGIRKDQWQ